MKEPKLSEITIFLMIFTALCFDGGQMVVGWIPVLGNIIAGVVDLFAFMTFFVWFKMHGIQMMTPKRLSSMLGAGVIEMIPFLNILPAWTLAVVYLIGTTKIQELASKHPTLAKGALRTGAAIKRMSKNPDRIPKVPFVDSAEN